VANRRGKLPRLFGFFGLTKRISQFLRDFNSAKSDIDRQTGLQWNTIPRMDDATILRLLDVERQTVAGAGLTLERTPYVVRAIGLESSWNGIVYSRFSPSETETVVNAEIQYFTQLNRDFEWKVYSHDEPADLLSHLRELDFRIGEEEALMFRDLRELPPSLMAPPPEGVTVSPVRNEQGIADFLSLESAIWSREPSESSEHLLSALSDPLQRNLGFVAYSDGKPIGFGRVTASPQSQFSGLWGGSVLPDFRGRGVYRALLSARIQHVLQYDSIRYLRVDALPTSRPILQKYGFKVVASTWPAEWPPAPVKR
jgi:GNAT superfamily N-acetyltransferase